MASMLAVIQRPLFHRSVHLYPPCYYNVADNTISNNVVDNVSADATSDGGADNTIANNVADNA